MFGPSDASAGQEDECKDYHLISRSDLGANSHNVFLSLFILSFSCMHSLQTCIAQYACLKKGQTFILAKFANKEKCCNLNIYYLKIIFHCNFAMPKKVKLKTQPKFFMQFAKQQL